MPIDVSTVGPGYQNDFHHPDFKVFREAGKGTGQEKVIVMSGSRDILKPKTIISKRVLVMPDLKHKTLVPLRAQGFRGWERVKPSELDNDSVDEQLAVDAFDNVKLKVKAEQLEEKRQVKFGDGYRSGLGTFNDDAKAAVAIEAEEKMKKMRETRGSCYYEFGGKLHHISSLEVDEFEEEEGEESNDDIETKNRDAAIEVEGGIEKLKKNKMASFGHDTSGLPFNSLSRSTSIVEPKVGKWSAKMLEATDLEKHRQEAAAAAAAAEVNAAQAKIIEEARKAARSWAIKEARKDRTKRPQV